VRHYRRTFRRLRTRGYTLIETALATIIIGTGIIATMQLMAAGTMSNSAATELTTAINLANNIHEVAVGLPFLSTTNPGSTTFKDAGGPLNYTYLWDMSGDSYSPPLDVTRNTITGYGNWTQKVTVQSVDPTSLTSVRPNSVSLPTARVTVIILHNAKQVYQTSFMVVASNG
jgi:type II secretory pathway pseudopilin PulG